MDFTALTTAVDATTIVAAVGVVAAVKVLPGFAVWGYTKVISFIGR